MAPLIPEAEARRKLCPELKVTCAGSACMMWMDEAGSGYCGMISATWIDALNVPFTGIGLVAGNPALEAPEPVPELP
jgi:hypothetical protein